jgi:hypothetical protein
VDLARKAYIPEQIPSYMCSFSGLKWSNEGPFIYYYGEGEIRFIGYSLDEGDLEKSLQRAIDRHRPVRVLVASPRKIEGYDVIESDEYYFLDAESLKINKKIRNLIKRAEKDVKVRETELEDEHLHFIRDFVRRKGLKEHEIMLRKLPEYVRAAKPLILEARQEGRLIAVTIADIKSSDAFSFYLFNFTSERKVPGASDLLLKNLIDRSIEMGKKVNMGLGINEGIRKFKLKWGAKVLAPFYLMERYCQEISLF